MSEFREKVRIEIGKETYFDLPNVKDLEVVNHGFKGKIKVDKTEHNFKITFCEYENKNVDFSVLDPKYTEEIQNQIFDKNSEELNRRGNYRYERTRVVGSRHKLSIIVDDYFNKGHFLFTIRGGNHKYLGILEIDNNETLLNVFANSFYCVDHKTIYSSNYFEFGNIIVPMFQNSRIYKDGFGNAKENIWPKEYDEENNYYVYPGCYFEIMNFNYSSELNDLENYFLVNEKSTPLIHHIINGNVEVFLLDEETDIGFDMYGHIICNGSYYFFYTGFTGGDLKQQYELILSTVNSIQEKRD